MILAFLTADVVDGLVDETDGMVLIEGDGSVEEVFGGALFEGRGTYRR